MSQVLFVAWHSGEGPLAQWAPVGRLEHTPSGYRFVYTKGARKLKDFRPFPGMSDLEAVYESEELFPLFANRLLAPSRPEYEAFLRWGGFDPANPPDPLAILGVTGGERVTDRLEVFPCPMKDADGCYVTKFFLHGIRWMAPATQDRILRLQPGERLALMIDFMNRHDPWAVAVRTDRDEDRFMIGYVPRYLAYDINHLCRRCTPDSITVTVERVNEDAPLDHRVLCRMRACWPEDLRPCSGEAFEPLVNVQEVSSVCQE